MTNLSTNLSLHTMTSTSILLVLILWISIIIFLRLIAIAFCMKTCRFHNKPPPELETLDRECESKEFLKVRPANLAKFVWITRITSYECCCSSTTSKMWMHKKVKQRSKTNSSPHCSIDSTMRTQDWSETDKNLRIEEKHMDRWSYPDHMRWSQIESASTKLDSLYLCQERWLKTLILNISFPRITNRRKSHVSSTGTPKGSGRNGSDTIWTNEDRFHREKWQLCKWILYSLKSSSLLYTYNNETKVTI